jgi:hypothetical protein
MVQTFLAIVLASHCESTFMDGHSCKSAAKLIEGPNKGMVCNSNRLLGSRGDTIKVRTYTSFNELGCR